MSSLRDLAREFCSCVEKGKKGENELERFRVASFEKSGVESVPSDRFAFPSPDKSVASEARTFTHVLFDAARVMFKELQRRKDGLYFKRMHILLKTQLTPWVVTLGKSADNKKRVKTRWQFMYRLLWQGITFVLKNNTMKDIEILMDAIAGHLRIICVWGKEWTRRRFDDSVRRSRGAALFRKEIRSLVQQYGNAWNGAYERESSRHLQLQRKIQTISSRRNGSIGFCSPCRVSIKRTKSRARRC